MRLTVGLVSVSQIIIRYMLQNQPFCRSILIVDSGWISEGAELLMVRKCRMESFILETEDEWNPFRSCRLPSAFIRTQRSASLPFIW